MCTIYVISDIFDMAGVIDEKAKFLDRLNDEDKGDDLKKRVRLDFLLRTKSSQLGFYEKIFIW